MKLRLLAACLALSAMTVPAVVHAQDAAPEHHTELGKHMEKVGKAFKKLRGQIGDSSQNDSSLQLVATMHDELQAALDLKPEKEADLPPDQQAAFQARYQDALKAFLAKLDKLSDLIKAGDNDGAAALVKTLGLDERKDHKQFRKPHND